MDRNDLIHNPYNPIIYRFNPIFFDSHNIIYIFYVNSDAYGEQHIYIYMIDVEIQMNY